MELPYAAGEVRCCGTLVVGGHSGRRPGVVVLPEFWGINDESRRRARMLAEQGYVALAADIHGEGARPATLEEASARMSELRADPARGEALIRGAIDALVARPEVDPTRLAAIGYCLGGAMALRAARMGLDLRAVASFHGVLSTHTRATPGSVRARVLVCHGAADPIVSPGSVASFLEEMREASVDCTFISYPGVTHAFTVPEADARAKQHGLPLAYDARADRASWASLLTLLSQTLDA